MSEENAARPASKSSDALVLRVASAAVLIPVTIAAVWFGGPIFAGLVAFLVVIMSFEWARMVDGREYTAVYYALAVGGAAALACAAAGLYPVAFAIAAVGAVGAAVASRLGEKRWRWSAFGAFYFIMPAAALIWLREEPANGRALVTLLFLIVWGADTGAYFTGRLIGGPKLAPFLSPQKTWAGAVGGMALGGLAGALYGPQAITGGNILIYAVIGASLGLASILGDMTESAFKRIFGLKDMSSVIPGHGGALDRLDGMIFATVALAASLYGQLLFAS